MNKYKILIDATSDLPKHLLESSDVEIIPIEFNVDGKRYLRFSDDRELSSFNLNSKLLENKEFKTSYIPASLYVDTAAKFLKDEYDILIVTTSSHLSACYMSAMIAKRALEKQFTKRNILVLDSLGCSTKISAIVQQLITNKNNDMSIEKNFNIVSSTIENIDTIAYCEMPNFLETNDRFKLKMGFFDKIVASKLILTFDENQKISIYRKIKNRTDASNVLFSYIKNNISDSETEVYITHGGCQMDAINLANRIKSEINKNLNINIDTMSLIVNCYLGPLSLCVSFKKKGKENG